MKKKILIVLCLVLIAITLIASVFIYSIIKINNTYFETDKEFEDAIIGNEIINPDRIVYKNKDGEVFEFKSESKSYDKIKALLSNSITEYDKNGDILTDEDVDNIHSKSFIEFDYQTASKNYIIQLEDNNNQSVIKLADTGGSVVTKKILNLNKIIDTLDTLSKNENVHYLNYQEFISRNVLDEFEYKYRELFKDVSNGAYQVKIDNLEQYNKFKDMCKIAIDYNVTENLFSENVIILTVSFYPKIETKVSIGNIKYTYSEIDNAKYGYTVHVLIVNKIVNTDCIYNNSKASLENAVQNDKFKVDYNKSAENLDENYFVTDIEEFMNEYKSAKTKVTEEEARLIAQKGFDEAERIVGAYDEETEEVSIEEVLPNNFFTRLINGYDEQYMEKIEVYCFTRYDDVINGVKIYVDKRIGKIVGGDAFGD